jgi:hypothetical protein
MLNDSLKSDSVTTVNQFPGGRRFLKPFLTFFNNLDDFWLYNYHKMNYDFAMNSAFSLIRDL